MEVQMPQTNQDMQVKQEMPKTATIYVQNLNEKVKISELKNCLFQMFGNIGVNIREVHAKKNIRLRGQAFVVCEDEEQAEQGINQLQNQILFGKPLRLSFSKAQSDLVTKIRGENVVTRVPMQISNLVQNKEIKKKKKLIQRVM
jgi:RNA recognition motif-containing protein